MYLPNAIHNVDVKHFRGMAHYKIFSDDVITTCYRKRASRKNDKLSQALQKASIKHEVNARNSIVSIYIPNLYVLRFHKCY